MNMKPLEPPHHIKVNRYLKHRLRFTEKEWSYYLNDEKGFTGEQIFEKLLMELPNSNFINLSDLVIQWNNSTIQIDSITITENKIYSHEVKHYEGDYFIDNERLYSISGKEMKNPFHQISKIENVLRECLNSTFKLPLETKIVFTNPHFTLYEALKNLPIILPTQLNRYMNRLSSSVSTSNISKNHIELAQKLLMLHNDKSPYLTKKIPSYHFDSIKKGVYCKFCSSFLMRQDSKTNLACANCGQTEKIEDSIIRSIEELALLFPNQRITTPLIKQWCNIEELSSKTIRGILNKNFDKVVDRKTYFYMVKEITNSRQ